MKAIVLEEFGGPDVLEYKDIAAPSPAAGQVLVKVHAAGVNPADWKMREGYLAQAFTHQLPVIPGWEMAGTVDSVGDGVSTFQPGDPVYSYNRMDVVQYGTFAEYSLANADMLAPMPTNLDYPTAATIPLTSLTAWQALIDFAGLGQGESVFIAAGAGGVGGFAIQIAKHTGARVCSSASAHKHDYLRSLGADAVIDYQAEDIAAGIKQFAEQGVDVVFDCTGSDDVSINFDYVKKGSGRVVTINGLLDTVPKLEECGAQFGVKAGLIFVEPNGQQLENITRLLEQQILKPLPVEVFPLQNARQALEKSQAGHVKGKLALQVC